MAEESRPVVVNAEEQMTQVNLILQYNPIGGGTPVPIEVTPFMNGGNSSLVYLQEVHTGTVEPVDVNNRCRTTNSLGRCVVRSIPVGGSPEAQYDIIVNLSLLEFVTDVPLESLGGSVRYSAASCNQNPVTFTGDSWCITKPNGAYAPEYYVTITLEERAECRDVNPPAPFCDQHGRLVEYQCNPDFNGSTAPFEPVAHVCEAVQCADGNYAPGICAEVVPGVPTCSAAEACRNNLLCEVTNIANLLPHRAGEETILIRGKRFGGQGGTVTFPTQGGGEEVVEVFPGSDWTDAQIAVPIPLSAVSGELKIHPNMHGVFNPEGEAEPATCATPSVKILAFKDQFSLLSVTAKSQPGVTLVAPGFTTEFTLLAHHNDRISRLKTIEILLLVGEYQTVGDLPIHRTVIAEKKCTAAPVGDAAARDGTLLCGIAIPASAATYQSPFTFVVTLTDDLGESESVVIVDSGNSVMAGDFDFNQKLSLMDAVVANRITRGALQATADHLLRDVDGDNHISLTDAISVLHFLTE